MASWPEANQRYLAAATAVARATLERYAQRVHGTETGEPQRPPADGALRQALVAAREAMPAPPAIERI